MRTPAQTAQNHTKRTYVDLVAISVRFVRFVRFCVVCAVCAFALCAVADYSLTSRYYSLTVCAVCVALF